MDQCQNIGRENAAPNEFGFYPAVDNARNQLRTGLGSRTCLAAPCQLSFDVNLMISAEVEHEPS